MSTTQAELVKFRSEQGIATITFNRPDKVNAFKLPDSRDAILEAFNKAQADESVRVIVFRGEGRAFSSGWDMSGSSAAFRAPYSDTRSATTRGIIGLFRAIATSSKPTIAMTHGYAVGAGLFVAVACDIMYSTKDCKFGLSEIRHNGPTFEYWAPWNVPRNMALEMAFTGDHFDGERMERAGLVNKTFPTYEALEKATYLLAKKICILDPFGIRINKYGMDLWYRMGDYAGVVDNVINTMTLSGFSEAGAKWGEVREKFGFKEFMKRREEKFEELEKESMA